MILRNRSFVRNAPNREAKKIYVFCEGKRREFFYFSYFQEIDSRINLVVHELEGDEDNSPLGLYNIACSTLIKTEVNSNPKYQLDEIDEVWIVFDTDLDKLNSRKDQIIYIRAECEKKRKWFCAQSNPCFEVWLYYHQTAIQPNTSIDLNVCRNWKNIVNDLIPGGFNSGKHPINLEAAIENSEKNFSHTNGHPNLGCTEVYYLGRSIFNSLREKITELLLTPVETIPAEFLNRSSQ